MKSTSLLLVIASALALTSSAIAGTAYVEACHLRPMLQYTNISTDGVEGVFGGGIEACVSYGADEEFEAGLEASYFDIDDVDVVPVLLNLRYKFMGKDDWFRPYAGLSAGCTFLSDGISDSFTYGPMAGALFKVADRFDINAGYRYLLLKDFDAHNFLAGLSYRF